MVLPSGCGLCGKTDDVLFCPGCKVMPYCGVEHQTAHRADHKSACGRIRRCYVDMEIKEQDLRDHPDYFTHNVGHFYGIWETRPYMRARAAYAFALTFVSNAESVQTQLNTLLEDLRLSRSDNMGSREIALGLMLRLDKDQEGYDFLRWWATTGDDFKYDWVDSTLPYLNIKASNPLEPIDLFLDGFNSLPHMVALTLIKVKLLFILVANQESSHVKDSKVIDRVLGLESSNIAKNPNVASCQDLQGEIVKIKAQIYKLYEAVNEKNQHFWPTLVNPGTNLDVLPIEYSLGSVEEVQMTLKLTWEAWNETFGAIDLINGALQGKMDAL